jgi:hypothetical protein
LLHALGGPPFRTDGAEHIEHQHWEFDFFSAATKIKGGTSGILQVLMILPQPPSTCLADGATNFGIGDTKY